VDPLIQVGGALLVLAGFILAQVGIVRTTSPTYLVLNLIGSAVLAVDASAHGQWGFLLLEGVWAIVSAIGLVRAVTVTGVAGRGHRRGMGRHAARSCRPRSRHAPHGQAGRSPSDSSGPSRTLAYTGAPSESVGGATTGRQPTGS
jgi:hypothetical protein